LEVFAAQAESAKVASSSDENRTGDNSSNLATVINGPGLIF
jgi:hypothetical protein